MLDDIRIHEITLCYRVSKLSKHIFQQDKLLPIGRAEIEESKGIKRQPSNIRAYDNKQKLIVAGEVKLPGIPEGKNSYNLELGEDFFLKVSRANACFFFTWDVNKLVLFDRSLWERPLYEKRVKECNCGHII